MIDVPVLQLRKIHSAVANPLKCRRSKRGQKVGRVPTVLLPLVTSKFTF